MKSLFLVYLCSIAQICLATGPSQCTYNGKFSQTDEFVSDYTYCDNNGITATSAATLTVDVAGTMGVCQMLEPDRSDEWLETNLDLKVRPYYIGNVTEQNDGSWEFTLDQYGDSSCAFAQRRTELTWGTDKCFKYSSGGGVVHELTFSDTTCGGLSTTANSQLKAKASANWVDEATVVDFLKVLKNATGLSYENDEDSKVWKRLFSSMTTSQMPVANPVSAYCYGIGERLRAPYHISEVYDMATGVGNTTVKMQKSRVYTPGNGWLCSYSCSADVQAAIDSSTDAVAQLAHMTMSPCVTNYANVFAAAGSAMDNSTKSFLASFIMYLETPRQCGRCYTLADQEMTFIAGFNTVSDTAMAYTNLNIAPVQSRMTFCEDDLVSTASVFLQDATFPDPDTCGATPTPQPTEPTSSSPFVSTFISLVFASLTALVM